MRFYFCWLFRAHHEVFFLMEMHLLCCVRTQNLTRTQIHRLHFTAHSDFVPNTYDFRSGFGQMPKKSNLLRVVRVFFPVVGSLHSNETSARDLSGFNVFMRLNLIHFMTKNEFIFHILKKSFLNWMSGILVRNLKKTKKNFRTWIHFCIFWNFMLNSQSYFRVQPRSLAPNANTD